MIVRTLSYGDLERMLLQLGFVRVSAAGAQIVFQQAESDTLIVLPPGRPDDRVDAIHLVAARRLLIEKGLVRDPDDFDTLANAATQDA